MSFRHKTNEYIKLLETNKGEALDFYFENLLEEICSRFTEKVNEGIEAGRFKPYRYLIMTVGFSPEPMIMWIKAFKPERVYFLYSADTEKLIDTIADQAGLRPSQVRLGEVGSSNTIDVYEKIKKFIDDDKLDLSKVAIDISGGKKSMVAGCTLAANYLGLDVLYVDYTNYNQHFRKPKPGSEIPVKLDDPLEVFGDREMQKGKAKFNSEDFVSAAEIFKDIKERVVNPRYYEMYEGLANGYKELENMKFKEAYFQIDKAVAYAEMLRNESFPITLLQKQLKVIKPLVDFPEKEPKQVFGNIERFWHIYGLFMSLADQYIEQGKVDLAALLTYRSLEMAVQYTLFKHGIYAGDANLKNFNEELLLEKVNRLGAELYGGSAYISYSGFPKKLGLMLGLMVLKALDDPMTADIDLKKILASTDARNHSRYAHGFTTLAIEEVKPFFFIVRDNVSEPLWRAERMELGYADKKTQFKDFVNLFKFVKIS